MRKASEMKVIDAGLRKRIPKEPPDICRDWRSDFSKIGPKITVRVIGTSGKSSSFDKYPNIPKAISTQMSNMLRLML